MGSKLVDVGASLDVGSNDLRELRRRRRYDILTRVAQASASVASAILGVLAAEAAYPVTRPAYYSYPFLPILFASLTTPRRPCRSWAGVIIISVVLFIVTFVFVALFNTAASHNYGVTTRYGVYSRSGDRHVMKA